MAKSLAGDDEKIQISIINACIALLGGKPTLERLTNEWWEQSGNAEDTSKISDRSMLLKILENYPNVFTITKSGRGTLVSSLSKDVKHIEKFVQTQRPNKPNRNSRKKPHARKYKFSGVNLVDTNTWKKKEIEHLSYVEKLEKLASKHGLEVTYNPTPFGPGKDAYICKVTVGDLIIKLPSYPALLYSTLPVAKQYVAQKAYEKLKEMLTNPSPRIVLPETADINVVVRRLKEMLYNRREGTWWEFLRSEYETKYQESINVDCVLLIKKNFSGEINISQDEKNNIGYMLKLEVNRESFTKTPIASQDEPPMDVACEPPPLRLPEDGEWIVYATYIVNCQEVCFRIVGEDHSVAFQEMVNDMELHYVGNSNVRSVNAPDTEHFYACCFQGIWYRVKLLKMNEEGKAEILFVDSGDSEVVNLSDLFPLEIKFLKLPCQSIQCFLAGLEICGQENSEIIESRLQELAFSDVLKAEIITKDAVRSVTLYATSTGEDININNLLIQIMKETLPPESGICEVYINEISPDGVIFLKVEPKTYVDLGTLLTRETHRDPTRKFRNEYVKKVYSEFITSSKEKLDKGTLRTANKNKYGKVFSCKLHRPNVPAYSSFKWSHAASDKVRSMAIDEINPLLLKVIKEPMDTDVAFIELFKLDHTMNPETNNIISINRVLNCNQSRYFEKKRCSK